MYTQFFAHSQDTDSLIAPIAMLSKEEPLTVFHLRW